MRSREEVNKIIAKSQIAKKRLQAAKNAGTPESQQADVVAGKDKASMETEIMKGEESADQMQKPSQEEMDNAMGKMMEKDLSSGPSKTTKSWKYKGK